MKLLSTLPKSIYRNFVSEGCSESISWTFPTTPKIRIWIVKNKTSNFNQFFY